MRMHTGKQLKDLIGSYWHEGRNSERMKNIPRTSDHFDFLLKKDNPKLPIIQESYGFRQSNNTKEYWTDITSKQYRTNILEAKQNISENMNKNYTDADHKTMIKDYHIENLDCGIHCHKTYEFGLRENELFFTTCYIPNIFSENEIVFKIDKKNRTVEKMKLSTETIQFLDVNFIHQDIICISIVLKDQYGGHALFLRESESIFSYENENILFYFSIEEVEIVVNKEINKYNTFIDNWNIQLQNIRQI